MPAAQHSLGVLRRRRAGLALILAGLATGGFLIVDSSADTGNTPPRPSAADAFTGPIRPAAPAPTVHPLPYSPPTRITIPAIGVDAPLTGLTTDDDHTLQPPPPDDKNLAGWYQEGTAPGSTGTAVIAGHLDTHTGPAVFYRIGQLHKKGTINILRKDGRTMTFTIDAVEQYEKSDFPSKKVYGRANRPELRLITCAGAYSKASSYSANIVVYAHLAKATPPPARVTLTQNRIAQRSRTTLHNSTSIQPIGT
ncbi:class F sortase [Streptomyces beijiangensis]|uniref:Class F sortase n=1 Tax=Streptomyces beijiangensis TaxID=163361 RepID=A0A939F9L6_9ACTN|nr:class F sortase [Streptomyces beijiangensis]MBO0514945.1 class F sortase [Streptomyces beijiangensis]